MRCSQCGRENPDNSVFCMGCGGSMAGAGSTLRTPRRSRVPRIALIVAVAAIVLAAAGGGYWYWKLRPVARGGVTLTPRVIVAAQDTEGTSLSLLDLDAGSLGAELARGTLAPAAAFYEVNGGAGGLLSLGAAELWHYPRRQASGAYVWPDGWHALVALQEGNHMALVGFDLPGGKPIEYLSGLDSLTVFVNREGTQFMALAEDRDGRGVYTAEIGSNRITALVARADMAWGSPGRGWGNVVYWATMRGSTTLYTAGFDGRGARAVSWTSGQTGYLALSEDGQVYYVSSDRLYRQPMNGDSASALSGYGEGKLNLLGLALRDDRLLALTGVDGNWALQFFGTDGSIQTTVDQHFDQVLAVSPAPDKAHWLAWTHHGDGDTLCVFDAQDQRVRVVFEGKQSDYVRWLPNNQLLYAQRDADGTVLLFVEDFSGKQRVQLAGGLKSLDWVGYSGGGHVGYLTQIEGAIGLYEVNLSTNVSNEVTESPSGLASPWLNTNGKAFYHVQEGQRVSVMSVDPDGSNEHPLIENAQIVSANLYQ